MNFQFIKRKQALGISHPDDFANWAVVVGGPMIKDTVGAENYDVSTLSWGNYSIRDAAGPRNMQENVGMFNRAIAALNLDFEHSELDDSPYVHIIQSIDFDARKQERYFQMIDIRPISELGTNLGNIERVDKMMVECGCNPINDSWIEYSPEDGRKTLLAICEAEVVPKYYVRSGREPIIESALANRFLACFDETVRFYGNAPEAPWEEGYKLKSNIQSKMLQSAFDSDFGLVLCDSKTIGFLLVADD